MLNRIMLDKNLYENEEPTWRMHMLTLMKKKRNIEIGQTLDEIFHQHYVVEKGVPVPEWRTTQPQWWVDYLKSLDRDDRNKPLQ